MAKPVKELILGTVSDLALDFLYYDRKEDEELPRGAIEQAIDDGELTVEDIVRQFRTKLIEGLDG